MAFSGHITYIMMTMINIIYLYYFIIISIKFTTWLFFLGYEVSQAVSPVMTPNCINLPFLFFLGGIAYASKLQVCRFLASLLSTSSMSAHENFAHFFFASLVGACPLLCFTICFSFCWNCLACCWVSKPLLETLPCTTLFICLWSFSCSLLVSSLLLVDPTQHARHYSPRTNCMVQPWSNLWMVCST